MASFEHGAKRTVYGICVHTTGDGIPAKVISTRGTHLDVARGVYLSMGSVGPHHVVDPFGNVETYADDGVIRHHAGLEAADRRSYLDGHWENDRNRIDPAVVAWWKARWPGVKSPSHLYPSKSINADYVGIELIPAGAYIKDKGWTWMWGTPPGFDKQRFSVEQYWSLAKLCNGIAKDYGLDLSKVGVLLGHEDVNPKTRPGYDPGDKIQAFSWSLLRGLLPRAQ